MKPKVEITANTIPQKVDGLKGAAPAVVFEFVERLTMATHKEAVRGIQRGPASGRIYEKYDPRRTHQASAPGERPMSDTGRLATSVQFERPTSRTKPEGFVGTNLLYGKYLELKPSTMGGRPWLLPAFHVATDKAEQLLARVFKRQAGRKR